MFIHFLVSSIEFVNKPLTKDEILLCVTRLLLKSDAIKIPVANLHKQLSHREKEYSTYLGNGIALPHIVLPTLKSISGILVVVKLAKPTQWWHNSQETSNPVHNKPIVHMVWGLISTKDQHLHFLKHISNIILDSQKCNALLSCSTPTELFKLFTQKKILGSIGFFKSTYSNSSSKTKNSNITEAKKKISESVYHEPFLLPPNWQMHFRPTSLFTKKIKKIISSATSYIHTTSTIKNQKLELWIIYSNKVASAFSTVDILSLGLRPKSYITFALTLTIGNIKNTTFYKETRIFKTIIKQCKLAILEFAIKELHDQQHQEKSSTLTLIRESNSLSKLKNKLTSHFKVTSVIKLTEYSNLSVPTSPTASQKEKLYSTNKSLPWFNLAKVLVFTDTRNSIGSIGSINNLNNSNKSDMALINFDVAIELFKSAIRNIHDDIKRQLNKFKNSPNKSKVIDGINTDFLNNTNISIIATHLEIIKDPILIEEVKEHLLSKYYNHQKTGRSNFFFTIIQGWEEVIKKKIKLLNKHYSPITRAKSNDWQDLERRISLELWKQWDQKISKKKNTEKKFYKKSILFNFLSIHTRTLSPDFPNYLNVLVAEELFPSDIIDLVHFIKNNKLHALVLKNINPHSHVAIMLSSYPINVFGLNNPIDFIKLKKCASVLIDGMDKELFTLQDFSVRHEHHQHVVNYNQDIERILKNQNVQPVSNHKGPQKKLFNDVRFLINIDTKHDVYELKKMIKHGLNFNATNEAPKPGIGLFRSELYFGSSKIKPSLYQQINTYQTLAELCYPEPVVIRTIDIAKDKPILFLEQKSNENTGVTTNHNEKKKKFFENIKRIKYFNVKELLFLREQLLALSTVAKKYDNIQVLFPMVVNWEDFFIYKNLIDEIEYSQNLKCGIMIESPALIFELPLLNNFVDFYSIGTNDLEKFLSFEPREQKVYSEPKNYISLFLALDNIIKHVQTKNSVQIPITLCGNHATNHFLLKEFIAIGIKQFSVPLSTYKRVQQFQQSFPISAKTTSKTNVTTMTANFKKLKNYLFNK